MQQLLTLLVLITFCSPGLAYEYLGPSVYKQIDAPSAAKTLYGWLGKAFVNVQVVAVVEDVGRSFATAPQLEQLFKDKTIQLIPTANFIENYQSETALVNVHLIVNHYDINTTMYYGILTLLVEGGGSGQPFFYAVPVAGSETQLVDVIDREYNRAIISLVESHLYIKTIH